MPQSRPRHFQQNERLNELIKRSQELNHRRMHSRSSSQMGSTQNLRQTLTRDAWSKAAAATGIDMDNRS